MKTKLCLMIAAILTIVSPRPAQAETGQSVDIQGWVTDAHQKPLMGASVALLDGDTLEAATMTDSEGFFLIRIGDRSLAKMDLKVSSMGYHTVLRSLVPDGQPVLHLELESMMIDIPGITVRPERNESPTRTDVSRESIDRRSHHSVISTNPISAIVQPNAVREGSQHSSKIRVNGTVPDYHINGVNVGADPNHYGAFSIIPSSVISELRFLPQGTDASFAVPAAIDLRTPQPFGRQLNGEIDFSLIEATGSLSLGTQKTFLLGALRKSVLDKVVKRLDIESDRRTLPPTNFQDVFVSASWKASPNWLVILDQYHVQDFLSYSTSHTATASGGVSMFQHTKESYLGARLLGDLGWSSLTVTASSRLGKEIYRAHPVNSLATGRPGFALDLTEYRRTWLLGVETDSKISDMLPSMVSGAKMEIVDQRETDVQQINWNFLPPDATSDNPHAYQAELNELYGNISAAGKEVNLSGYCSATFELGRSTLVSGLRLDRFGALSKSGALTFRSDLSIPVGEGQKLSVFVGSFAENPIGRVLQPYQVLIRHDLASLTPQKTYLASSSYQHGALSVGLFGKLIRHQPILKSDFAFVVDDDGQATVYEGFLTMRSEGKSSFVGGSVTAEIDNLFATGIELYGFYSYSHAVKTDGRVTVPYDLDAPHRLVLQSNYQVSERLSIGADLGLRSGYPYTSPQGLLLPDLDHYSENYVQAAQEAENSARFPMSASFDLHGEFQVGSIDLYLNIANITNRSNPIVNTIDGFVYDAGVLPSLGLRYRL